MGPFQLPLWQPLGNPPVAARLSGAIDNVKKEAFEPSSLRAQRAVTVDRADEIFLRE